MARAPRTDLTPGSADIPKIAWLLAELSEIPAPDVPGLRSVEEYWGLLDNPGALDGDALVHGP